MRLVNLFIIFSPFFSCKNNSTQIGFFKTRNFILVDTFQQPPIRNLHKLEVGSYPIYYIGGINDTIRIGKKYAHGRIPFPNWPKRFIVSPYSSQNLEIKVDTSFIVYNDGWDKNTACSHAAYLITFKNKSDSIVWIGSGFSLQFLHRELQNDEGRWVKAEENSGDMGICGTGQPIICLKPGEIILSKFSRFRRTPFLTDCRLVFGYDNKHVYSNVFKEYSEKNTLYK